MKNLNTLASILMIAAASAGVANANSDTRFVLFEHDTTQITIPTGDPTTGIGSQFVIAGDLSQRQGGAKVGRSASQCVVTSQVEIFCTGALSTAAGQVTFQGVVNSATFFANQPVDFAVTGGTGTFRTARGTVTIRILTVPASGTDSEVTIDLW